MPSIKDDREIAPIQWGCGRSTSKVYKKKHWKQTFKTTTMTDPGKKKYKFRKSTSEFQESKKKKKIISSNEIFQKEFRREEKSSQL